MSVPSAEVFAEELHTVIKDYGDFGMLGHATYCRRTGNVRVRFQHGEGTIFCAELSFFGPADEGCIQIYVHKNGDTGRVYSFDLCSDSVPSGFGIRAYDVATRFHTTDWDNIFGGGVEAHILENNSILFQVSMDVAEVFKKTTFSSSAWEDAFQCNETAQ